MIRTWALAAVILVSSVGLTPAQPYPPGPPPPPVPGPSNSVEGRWYFRGDPQKPCSIQSVDTPQGPMLVLTNENGTQSYGRLAWGGRVVAYDWNQTAYFRGNMILWPHHDFWSR